MGLSCAIVGLPNVGKSTIFNALTQTQAAEATNYPFSTIDPNTGRVNIPDDRLRILAELESTEKITPVQVEIVDIAGLVRGSSQGAGRGNAFLVHIRPVTAMLQVVRCFDDDSVMHVDGAIDPVRDIETVDLELIFKDEETVKNRLERLAKRLLADPQTKETAAVCERVLAGLRDCIPVRSQGLAAAEVERIRDLSLLTVKPMLFVCNVDEAGIVQGNRYSERVVEHARRVGAETLLVCGKFEAELAGLPVEERPEFLKAMGLSEPGLNVLVRAAQRILDLITFFTSGPREVHAWQIRRGTAAPAAAGAIHSDLEQGFIRAEAASFDDYVRYRGEKGCREAGRLRSEGREYVLQDGDVMHFLCKT